jgi:hypothetical protein
MMMWLVTSRPWSLKDTLTVGTAAALLIAIRVQLGMYVAVALAMLAYKVVKSKRSAADSALLILASLVPTGIVGVQELFINRWMTGSLFTSPYDFGDLEFRSVDFSRPELAAVLWHPLHSLLTYHPLYAVCFVALLLNSFRNASRLASILQLTVAGVIAFHIYLHASWYCWWLGGFSFGLRGLAVASVILVPVFIAYLDKELQHGRLITSWLIFATIAAVWSYLFLSQGVPRYITWQQLLQGQWAELYSYSNLAVPATCTAIVVMFGRMWNSPSTDELLLRGAALFLLCLVLRWIAWQAIPNHYIAAAATIISATVGVPALAAWMGDRNILRPNYRSWFESITAASVLAVFICTAVLFGILVVKTENSAGQIRYGRTFTYRGAMDRDEVRASYLEYLQIPGFDDKKIRLAQFLDRWSQAHAHQ